MREKLPEYVFHQFDYLFDKMDGAYFGEAEIAGILHGAKQDGIYPGADYVYRYIQCLQIRLREEKERTLHHKYKRCLDNAWGCHQRMELFHELVLEEARTIALPNEVALKEYRRKRERAAKWQKRWLKIAEQFKEGV